MGLVVGGNVFVSVLRCSESHAHQHHHEHLGHKREPLEIREPDRPPPAPVRQHSPLVGFFPFKITFQNPS